MLVLTSGEPFSVNIELAAPRLAAAAGALDCPVVVVGSLWHWRDQTRRLGVPFPDFRPVTAWADVGTRGLYILDVAADGAGAAPAETLAEAVRGELAVRALRALATLPSRRQLAVVTLPIDKHACAAAGFAHPGQTEYFETLWRGEAVMLLAGPRLRVGLATNHLPLAAVTAAITGDLLGRKLDLLVGTMREHFGIARPRLAVAALNPHAGDGGLFGDEDRLVVAPAVAAARVRHAGLEITGPLPADTVFHRAYAGAYDAVLAMYHDQGLAPLKLAHFDTAVNVSGGLRHLRVSPDHGPAADLFLRGQASAASLAAALDLAVRHLGGTSPGTGP